MQDGGTAPESRARRVLIVLPFDMSARNFITSPVAASLSADPTLDVTIVSREPGDGERLKQFPGRPIAWRPMLRPFRLSLAPGLGLAERAALIEADTRAALGHYTFLSLVYRFNSIRGFRGFLDRVQQSRPLRRLAFKEGLPTRRWLGFPAPRSQKLFGALRRFYFSAWQRHRQVERLLDDVRPDALVITHLQSSTVTPYVLAAHARGVPILGINGSWDQPTTKGPMLPHVDRVLAQSRQVVDDLAVHHGYPREKTEVVGWPQMDVYSDTGTMVPRADFLKRIGLSAEARYILVAAYSDRLGAHEPEMCRKLREAVARGDFGAGAALYIRSHPLDRRWKERFGALHEPPIALVEPPNLGALDHLTNLVRHAEAVIAAAGTINLDAVALDTPSIAVAFEEENLPYHDRAARRYDMEHIASIMSTGGIRKVGSLDDLMGAVRDYMADRTRDADGRERLRLQHLAPLDGRASQRIAQAIAGFARSTTFKTRKNA